MNQWIMTGVSTREDNPANWCHCFYPHQFLILNNNTLYFTKDSKWKKRSCMNESKSEPPKKLLSTAFCRGGRKKKRKKKLCYEDKKEARGNNYYIREEAVYTRLPSCRRTGNMWRLMWPKKTWETHPVYRFIIFGKRKEMRVRLPLLPTNLFCSYLALELTKSLLFFGLT